MFSTYLDFTLFTWKQSGGEMRVQISSDPFAHLLATFQFQFQHLVFFSSHLTPILSEGPEIKFSSISRFLLTFASLA